MNNNPKVTEGDDENSVAINLSQIEENCLSSNHSAKIILNQGITIGSLCTTCKLLIKETLYRARLSRDQQNYPTLLSYPERPTTSKPASTIINPDSTKKLNELLNDLRFLKVVSLDGHNFIFQEIPIANFNFYSVHERLL